MKLEVRVHKTKLLALNNVLILTYTQTVGERFSQ